MEVWVINSIAVTAIRRQLQTLLLPKSLCDV